MFIVCFFLSPKYLLIPVLPPPIQWRSGVNVLKRNSVRLAEVWLDDYAQYYYQRIGNERGDYGDVTDRRELR